MLHVTCAFLDCLLMRCIGDVQRGIYDVCRAIGDVCRVVGAVRRDTSFLSFVMLVSMTQIP